MKWIAVCAALLLAACSINRKSSQFECNLTSDCPAGRVCSDGLCVTTGVDAPTPPGDGPPVVDAAVDAKTCPDQCTSCSEGHVCTIDCAAGANCNGPIVCPAGFDCIIRCNTQNSCRAGVNCLAGESCDVQCTSPGSCRNISCGPGRCAVNCTGQNSCRGNTVCGTSCACDVKCAFGTQSCENVQCTAFQCDTGLGCNSQFPGCNVCQ